MFILKIIRLLFGYTYVHLSGINATAFLNFCISKQFSIWDISSDKDTIVFKMYISDYKKIRNIRREFERDIHINHKKIIGLPNKVMRISRRKSVIFGITVYCSIIFALSQFLWCVNITGNKRISNEMIFDAYSQLGIKIGMPKNNIDSYKLRDKLPLIIRDISWCSFNLEGSVLTINVTEIDEFDKSDKNCYSNIIAKYDGIIESINVTLGNTICFVGDVVKKGDVLVSGAPQLNSQNFTYSSGEILAKTKRTIEITVNKYAQYDNGTNKFEIRRIIEIFGLRFPLYLDKVHFNNKSKINIERCKLFGDNVSIKIYKRTFEEVKIENFTHTKDTATNEAISILLSEVKKFNISNLEISNLQVEEEADFFRFIFKCECIEDIGEHKKIIISELN